MQTEFTLAERVQIARIAQEDARRALAEDLGAPARDVTAQLIAADAQMRAELICRESARLCGQIWFDAVLQQCDAGIAGEWLCAEGQTMQPGQTIWRASGNARALLTAERSALNFLQLLSGVASEAARLAALIAGTRAVICDTRKTLPGLRFAQKYAVRIGGGTNHRFGLYDAILIKENHIAAAGGVAAALAAADVLARTMTLSFVQIEVETLEQLQQALGAGARMILLDNMNPDQLRRAVQINQTRARPAILEASGGVSEENLRTIAQSGIDRISIGALTKNVRAVDFSLRLYSV